MQTNTQNRAHTHEQKLRDADIRNIRNCGKAGAKAFILPCAAKGDAKRWGWLPTQMQNL
jgi:hypothetical protein